MKGVSVRVHPSRFRFTVLTVVAVMLVGAFGVLIGPFTTNVSAVPDAHTWDGGGADAYAGTHANWDTDIAPTAGDAVIFNAGALLCTWNLSIATNTFSMDVGYTGTITFASDFNTGAFTIAAGTLDGAGYTLTCAGNFAHSAGTIVAVTLNLIMTGDG